MLDPATKLKKQAQSIHQKLSSNNLQERLATVDGIQYSVQAGGSKLFRIRGVYLLSRCEVAIKDDSAKEDNLPTPKRVVISGIPFLRSKNGNLYRESIVKRNGYGSRFVFYSLNNCRAIPGATTKTALCKRFTNTGTTPQSLLTVKRLGDSLGVAWNKSSANFWCR